MPRCANAVQGKVNWLGPCRQLVQTRKPLGDEVESYSSASVPPCLASVFIRPFSQCAHSSSGPSLLCRSWLTGYLIARHLDTPGRWGRSKVHSWWGNTHPFQSAWGTVNYCNIKEDFRNVAWRALFQPRLHSFIPTWATFKIGFRPFLLMKGSNQRCTGTKSQLFKDIVFPNWCGRTWLDRTEPWPQPPSNTWRMNWTLTEGQVSLMRFLWVSEMSLKCFRSIWGSRFLKCILKCISSWASEPLYGYIQRQDSTRVTRRTVNGNCKMSHPGSKFAQSAWSFRKAVISGTYYHLKSNLAKSWTKLFLAHCTLM